MLIHYIIRTDVFFFWDDSRSRTDLIPHWKCGAIPTRRYRHFLGRFRLVLSTETSTLNYFRELRHICSGRRIRTSDLEVMSLPSYLCSIPQFVANLRNWTWLSRLMRPMRYLTSRLLCCWLVRIRTLILSPLSTFHHVLRSSVHHTP